MAAQIKTVRGWREVLPSEVQLAAELYGKAFDERGNPLVIAPQHTKVDAVELAVLTQHILLLEEKVWAQEIESQAALSLCPGSCPFRGLRTQRQNRLVNRGSILAELGIAWREIRNSHPDIFLARWMLQERLEKADWRTRQSKAYWEAVELLK